MPSHIGSYDGKGDPDSARIWWNSQKVGSILDYEYRKHLGLHEEQRISGFVHGLRTKSLVEHLSTDLPSTYKGLTENTYTWVEAREEATNGASSDRRDSFERSKKSSWDNNRGQKNKDIFSPYRGPNHGLLPSLSKSPKEILATEKAARSFEPPPKMFGKAVNSGQLSHLVKGIKKERTRSSDTPQGESKKDKSTAPAEAPILMAKIFGRKVGRVYMDSRSSYEIIYENCFEKLNPTIKATKVDLKTTLVGFSGERSWSIGEVPLEITIGDAPLSRTETLNFVIVRNKEGQKDTCHKRGKGPQLRQREGKNLDQTVTIEKQLPKHFKKELQNLLKSNADVFAWTHADMTGISRTIMVEGKPFNTKHKLNEYSHVKPIKQNKRGLGPDRNMAACKETKELIKAGILWKVKNQTWVANPVMVKKSDRGWRRCMNFTNINKACPKDCYPLPEIDWKIESLSGFRLKCFLDTYKGYHQIQMAEEYKEKTTFYAGKGVFCYKKMPFGLKNAGATYQRLVDKVFSHQIGRNLKAYVDDMVIKRHLITKQGIKANPSKVKAVTDLDQPRTLKDIQSLNGKLAALSRFLSKGAERSLAFFKVRKGCKDKKRIQWTTEADKALEKIKKLVQALPTLTAPRVGETLTIHLAASKESISVVLAAKRNEGWTLIYFEHDIVFLRRNQKETRADFLVEIPFEDNKKKEKPKEEPDSNSNWRLHTDGASDSDGSGAGLMLIDLEGKEYTYALRFEFETTNNEAEYEALLAGLRIAQEMEIAKVAIFLDS
ncbi:reverse transcriptase domain-containing protein [Tanacetum coccineum]